MMHLVILTKWVSILAACFGIVILVVMACAQFDAWVTGKMEEVL